MVDGMPLGAAQSRPWYAAAARSGAQGDGVDVRVNVVVMSCRLRSPRRWSRNAKQLKLHTMDSEGENLSCNCIAVCHVKDDKHRTGMRVQYSSVRVESTERSSTRHPQLRPTERGH